MYKNISVCMSVYMGDEASQVFEAIESCVKQTIEPKEIIIVIDGPIKDEVNEVVEKESKKCNIINIIRLKENNGLGNALRIGVLNAKNELIARMDSDDICEYDRFEKQINIFNTLPNISIVGGGIREFVKNVNNIICEKYCPEKDKDIRHLMHYRCSINHVTVMFKRSDILSVGNYESFKYNEDYNLWIKMILKNLHFYNIQEILVNVRVGEDMYRRRGGIQYFKSELKIQKLMLNKKFNNIYIFIYNITVRVFVQLLCSNRIRELLYKNVFRDKIK